MARPTPLDLVFPRIAESTFPRIAASLAASGADPADRDAFLMDREVITLLHELRPEEGLGDAMDQMVALVHHAYLAWASGAVTISVSREAAMALLGDERRNGGAAASEAAAYYAQFPERMIWASVIEDEAPEPLDGVFVSEAPGGDLRVLGIFGIRPDRAGFSAVEASGARVEGLAREDGSPLFDPKLDGGAAAGLRSIIGEAELLELGWRTRWKP
jgi:hypothetical protein